MVMTETRRRKEGGARIGLGMIFSAFLFLACPLEEGGGGGGAYGLSEQEIVTGLKTALEVGSDSAASRLGRLDGYWRNEVIRILLPEDVRAAFDYADSLEAKANALGLSGAPVRLALLAAFNIDSFQGLRDELWLVLNRAAETAAPRSVPIFKRAITDMTIRDGVDILQGEDTAATVYLEAKTERPLVAAYSPVVDSALNQVNATTLWVRFSTDYNRLRNLYAENAAFEAFRKATGFEKVPPTLRTDLGAYATEKALDGLFHAVGREEMRIRRDPVARVTEILEKVFGAAEN